MLYYTIFHFNFVILMWDIIIATDFDEDFTRGSCEDLATSEKVTPRLA